MSLYIFNYVLISIIIMLDGTLYIKTIKIISMENKMDVTMEENSSHEINKSDDEPLSKRIKLNESQFNDLKEGLLDGMDCSNMSKRQKKKLIKKLQWAKWKPQKRAKEKEKLKQKKAFARLNNITFGPSRKMLKQSTMASSSCKVRVVIDFSFDHLMNHKDLCKSLKQLNHCYSLNRRATNPMQFYVTNFSGSSEQEMSKNMGYNNWDVHFLTHSYLEVFNKDELVYLTSDSPNVINELDDKKVYIIGGLVDHNAHKGLCYELAQQQGIAHAQLPIGEYIDMTSRKTLSIDHVFEIILKVTDGKSWKESFLEVLPQRKGAMEKTTTQQAEMSCT